MRKQRPHAEAAAPAAANDDARTPDAEAPDAPADGSPPPPDPAADLARLKELMAELAEAQGETPLILLSVDRNAVAAVVQDWTGIPTGRMLTSQTEKALQARRALVRARGRSGPRDGDDRAARADQPRRSRRAGKAGRRVPAVRSFRRRQDRNGAGACRDALRRRAEPHLDQHVRVPGGAHRLDPQGRASRLCRLWQGRHPHRSRSPQALFGRSCSTRSRRRTPTCTRSSSRSSTRA